MIAPVVDGSRAPSRLAPAHEAIRRGEIDIVSVGAFDSLLLCRAPDPDVARELLGRRLIDEGLLAPFVTASLFAAMRARAELLATRARQEEGGGPGVTLAEIHAQMPGFALTRGPAATAEAERVLVGDLSFLDPAVLELLHGADAAGIAVIVVAAECALPETELRELLDRCGLSVRVRAVFTPASEKVASLSDLFRAAIEAVEAPPKRVMHVGTDAEVEAARPAGLRSFAGSPAAGPADDVIALEGIVDERQGAPGPDGLDLVVGDAGLTATRRRFALEPPPPHVPAHATGHWSTGGIVFGPVLAAFAGWVVDGARRRGWRRVHCLSSEHTLLGPLLEECASDGADRVEVVSLGLSELLCARAAISSCDYGELRAFLERPVAPTVRELCSALGLLPTDLGDLAAHPDGRLDDPALREVALGRIIGDARVRERVLSEAAMLRERLRGLVERSVPDDTLAVVDLGARGLPQRLLARALGAAGSHVRVVGRSLLTTGDAVDAIFDGAAVDGFLASGGAPAPFARLVDGFPELLRRVAAGEQGSVVDLAPDGSPRLARGDRRQMESAEVRATRDGIAAFQALHRAAIPTATSELATSAPMARRVLQRFASMPDEREIDMFGEWWPEDRVRPDESDELSDDADRRPRLAECSLAADTGEGFASTTVVRRSPTRSADGVARVRLRVSGEGIARVQLVPAAEPAVIRVDSLVVRLSIRGKSEPTVLTFASRVELLEWQLDECSWLAENLLTAHTATPQMVLVIDNLLYGTVYAVTVTATLATVELPQSAIASDGTVTFGRTRAPVLGQRAIDLWIAATGVSESVARRLQRRSPDRR